MGCSTSKLDALPAVALCRDRCAFVEDALHHSYAFADAHVAYARSLKTLGYTLHQFFDDRNVDRRPDPPSAAKPDNSPPPPNRSPSSQTSDSHIQFDSDSDSDSENRNTDSESFNKNRHDYFDQQNLISSPVMFNSRSYRYNSYSTYHDEFGVGDWPASKTPPPPTPNSSAWDFLNFFEPFEKYEPPYSPGRDTKQVKESKKKPETVSTENDSKVAGATPTLSREKCNDDVSNKSAVVPEKERRSAEPESNGGQRCVSELMRQVQVQFEKASESGHEVSKMFDAGRFQYPHKHSVSQASSKMLHAVAPLSKPVPYTNLGRSQGLDDDELAVFINSRNLTATVKKLYMWEKKLYDEVKAEEKLRIIYARKCRQIRSLDHEKGGESFKVDSIRTVIRTLSTQIKISIQVIDKTSISINKLRDEELWLQINELLHRLLEMWKDMLECHRCQSQTIMAAENFDAIGSDAKLDNAHLEVAIQLKFELQIWALNFSNWIESHKSYIRALNAWLQRCLPSESEEIPDGGVSPFSPGKAEAPPVFVIVDQWSQAMERLSEMEVTEAIHGFYASINGLLEQHNVEVQQMVTANKELDRKVKILEREEQKMQKLIHAREKKLMTLPASGIGSLHSGLRQIFMAIERYAANFKQACDELHLQIEEGKFSPS